MKKNGVEEIVPEDLEPMQVDDEPEALDEEVEDLPQMDEEEKEPTTAEKSRDEEEDEGILKNMRSNFFSVTPPELNKDVSTPDGMTTLDH